MRTSLGPTGKGVGRRGDPKLAVYSAQRVLGTHVHTKRSTPKRLLCAQHFLYNLSFNLLSESADSSKVGVTAVQDRPQELTLSAALATRILLLTDKTL